MSASTAKAAPEEKAAHQGRFVWYELMTTDAEAAEKFYAKAVGWTACKAPPPNGFYTLVSAGNHPVAGMMTMPPELCAAGVQTGWRGFVGVADVDEATARLKSAGGQVHKEPTDIPTVGRFSAVTDPQGAAFLLFRGTMEEPGAPPPPGTPGTIGWHELQVPDRDAAFDFYAKMFGWKKSMAVDMGPMGLYQIFARDDDVLIGGMMTKMPDVPAPFWLYYFNVENTNAAIERIKGAGGKIVHGPQQVPGGNWIAQAIDPQGVLFAIVGPG